MRLWCASASARLLGLVGLVGCSNGTDVADATGDPKADCVTVRDYDEGADGWVDATFSYTDAPDGTLQIAEGDNDADGSVDYTSARWYDDNHHLLAEETVRSYDGWVSYAASYSYDDAGHLLTKLEHEDGVGELLLTTYTYNEHGNVVTEARDYGDDGTVEGGETYTHAYDDEGRVVTMMVENNRDSSDWAVYTYSYDEAGDVLTVDSDYEGSDSEGDDPADGIVDRTCTYAYDGDRNLVGVVFDRHDADAAYRLAAFAFAYTEDGKVDTVDIDSDGDGDDDRRFTSTYPSATCNARPPPAAVEWDETPRY